MNRQGSYCLDGSLYLPEESSLRLAAVQRVLTRNANKEHSVYYG